MMTRPYYTVMAANNSDILNSSLSSIDLGLPPSIEWQYNNLFTLTLPIKAEGNHKENGMPKDKAEYTLELEKDMMQFVEQMTAKYDLQDVSKAVRCLVNYARDVEEAQDAIFADIRCLNCD